MASTFQNGLHDGWSRATHHRGHGASINAWGASLNDFAHRLDGMDVSPEVAEVLRELFVAIGKLAQDAAAS
jgi:hypothetical protein